MIHRHDNGRPDPIKITSRTTLREIRRLLAEDGYAHVDAAEVRRAAARGCLLWTRERLTTTDGSRIDARPECWNEGEGR